MATAWAGLVGPKEASVTSLFDIEPTRLLTAVFALGENSGFGLLLLITIFVSTLMTLLSSFRTYTTQVVATGTALALLGAGLTFVVGFPFVTDGPLDRGNAFAGFGAALAVAAILHAAVTRSRTAGAGVMLVVTSVLFVGNLADVTDARRAGADLSEAVHLVETLGPDVDVVVELPNRGGYIAATSRQLETVARLRGAPVGRLWVETAHRDPPFEPDVAIRFAEPGEPARVVPLP